MDSLPAEITAQIASFLPSRKNGQDRQLKRQIAPYATINSSWNMAIEAVLWRSLKLRDVEWDEFVAGIGDEKRSKRRKKLLRCLNYTVTWTTTEEDEVGNRHDRLFSERMVYIYDSLADWGEIQDMALREVHLNILHPENDEDDKEDSRGNLAYLYIDRSVFGERRPLPHIRQFYLEAGEARLWPGDVGPLLAPFDSVQELLMELHDYERKDRNVRRKARIALATAIDALPQSLLDLELILDHEPPGFHGFQPPDLTDHGVDVFSRSLRNAMQKLRSLTLTASQLSVELFWPESPAENQPTFPRLAELFVATEPTTCAGAWLLLPSRTIPSRPSPDYRDESDYSDSEYEDHKAVGKEPLYSFRTLPDQQAIDAFYLALGRAHKRMPALKALGVEITEESLIDSLSWFCFLADNRYEPRYTPMSRNAHFADSNYAMVQSAPKHGIDSPRLRWGGQGEFWYEPGGELRQLWNENMPGVELEIAHAHGKVSYNE